MIAMSEVNIGTYTKKSRYVPFRLCIRYLRALNIRDKRSIQLFVALLL